MEQKLRVGVIGLGRAGFTIHVKGLVDHPQVRVAAVADNLPERVDEARTLTGCRGYADYRQLLADPEIDLVTVATPTHTHAAIAIEAMETGKHVVVEKLMATSVAEVDAMIDAARRCGKVLTVFQNGRLGSDFRLVQETVASGRLGRIATVKIGRYWYNRRNDWQTLQKYGGGVLNVHGAHLVDMGLQIVPDAEVVFADLKRNVSFGDADDHAKILLRGGHGTLLDIELFQDAALGTSGWHLVGQYGSLRIDGSTGTIKWYDPALYPELAVDEGPAAQRKYTLESIQWQTETVTLAPERATGAWYSLLYQTLTEGRPLFVTPESVRRQLEVMAQIRAAAGL